MNNIPGSSPYQDLFAHITAEEFRKSLEQDYGELESAFENGGWKSVHVLSGSIIEALLVDHLISMGHISEAAGLKLDLNKAIEEAVKLGILSQRTSELATVVRSYRNLIHPGRIIRMNERIDKNSATVAKALVEIIVAEVAEKKRASYGNTAEQIISKIERDSSVVGILKHLLAETNEIEIKRLLLQLLPQRYMTVAAADLNAAILNVLEQCFQAAKGVASDDVKMEVAQRFVKILKEEDESTVRLYSHAFLRAPDLRWLSEQDRKLVTEHLLHRMKRGDTAELLNALKAITNYLSDSEIPSYVDAMVMVIAHEDDDGLRKAAQENLEFEFIFTSAEVDAAALSRIEMWISTFERSERPEIVSRLSRFRAWLVTSIELSENETSGGDGNA